MAQPVTPQDHIIAATQRRRDQMAAAKQLARDLADERAAADATRAPALPIEGE